jgi:hypothetical protein
MRINKIVCDIDKKDINGSGYYIRQHGAILEVIRSKDVPDKEIDSFQKHFCSVGCLTRALAAHKWSEVEEGDL